MGACAPRRDVGLLTRRGAPQLAPFVRPRAIVQTGTAPEAGAAPEAGLPLSPWKAFEPYLAAVLGAPAALCTPQPRRRGARARSCARGLTRRRSRADTLHEQEHVQGADWMPRAAEAFEAAAARVARERVESTVHVYSARKPLERSSLWPF